MKLTKQQSENINQCITDLQYYYETCGNDQDKINLEFLKIHLNSINANLQNINVIYETVNPNDSKNENLSFRFGG